MVGTLAFRCFETPFSLKQQNWGERWGSLMSYHDRRRSPLDASAGAMACSEIPLRFFGWGLSNSTAYHHLGKVI